MDIISGGGGAAKVIPEAAADKGEQQQGVTSFEAFELDPRLTKALQRTNIIQPTLIQAKAIPLALAGKDILAKARTGSGKTLAYLLPILHHLLTTNTTSTTTISGATPSQPVCRCLILVPTKELARQVCNTIEDLLHYGPRTSLQPTNLATEESLTLQQGHLATHPTVIVSTPTRLLPHLEAGNLRLLPGTLDFLVIDEADLVLSFGYAADMQRLVSNFLPKTPQTFLMSATLTAEVEQLKALVLRSPVILRLTEGEEDEDAEEGSTASHHLQQYIIRVPTDEDKFLLMYVILKLKLLKGKLLIFANDVERCFRLRLFLEQFGVKTCLLNPELPLTSRHHIVDEFNRGVYDIIIASDQQPVGGGTTASKGRDKSKGKRRKSLSSSKETGVARGVDFRHVNVVINFDLPLHADSYVHRVGRTARGTASGTAISFVLLDDEGGKEGSSSKMAATPPKAMMEGGTEALSEEEASLKAIIADQEARGHSLEPYAFDLHQLDGFRYRCGDALRSVTPASIRAARLQAIKEEIARCERLKGFWEERPKDLALLRHDKNLGVIKARPHLKHVPGYLMEQTAEDETKGRKELANGCNTGSGQKLTPLPQADPQMNRTPGPRRTKRRGPPSKSRGNLLKRVKK